MMEDVQRGSQTVEPTWVDGVLRFWFEDLSEVDWFNKSDDVDAQIRNRFGALHEGLVTKGADDVSTRCALLAAVIVIDQFSRNLFRGDPGAYAADPIARRLAMRAIKQGFDKTLTGQQRLFLYLPFQHSEDAADQRLSVNLIKALGHEEWEKDAVEHKEIIDRFGRFPHRNAALARQSTPEEIEFLRLPMSWF